MVRNGFKFLQEICHFLDVNGCGRSILKTVGFGLQRRVLGVHALARCPCRWCSCHTGEGCTTQGQPEVGYRKEEDEEVHGLCSTQNYDPYMRCAKAKRLFDTFKRVNGMDEDIHSTRMQFAKAAGRDRVSCI